jgi:hypothetical protein
MRNCASIHPLHLELETAKKIIEIKERDEKKGNIRQLRVDARMTELAAPLSHGDELQASTGLPPEVREFVITKLAEILVLDYQQYHVVTRPTVAKGSACNRRLLDGVAYDRAGPRLRSTGRPRHGRSG